MKIGIIGAGFTGLAAAHELAKNNHHVSVFEKEAVPGGLAIGYRKKKWAWTLETHYHHWFTNDTFILELAKEINHPVVYKKPHTNILINGTIYEMDSIKAFLSFPELSLIERVRQLVILGIVFKINPFWKPLERHYAHEMLPRLIGEKAYQMIWEPQLINKLGKYKDDVSLVWFWSRIKKRTPFLAYPEGGYLTFAQHLTESIEKKNGNMYFSTEIQRITQHDSGVTLQIRSPHKKWGERFDKIIVTLPSVFFTKIAPQLPAEYKNLLGKLKGIGAINLILRLKKPFLPHHTYWLSICNKNSPIMAIIEHTNYMSPAFYNNEHLVYIGKYLPSNSQQYLKSKEELLKMYHPVLSQLNPTYKDNLIDYELFKTPFAQPIIPTNYSKVIPSMKTPLKDVFLANIEQVYPWDRGTNYAVELGKKVSFLV